jgi:hypothetical protein
MSSSPPDADEREALLLPPEGSAPDAANRLSSPFAFARRWRKGAVPWTVAGSVALLTLLGLAGFDFASRAERAADGGSGRDGSVRRIPDFGEDTESIESILAGIGAYPEAGETLKPLTVYYGRTPIDGHTFTARYDAEWLSHEPMVSWNHFADPTKRYAVAMFDPDAKSGLINRRRGQWQGTPPKGQFLHALWTHCDGGNNLRCAAPGRATVSYVTPGPPRDDAPHKYVFVLFEQSKDAPEVFFDAAHVNGGLAWHRNNRMPELIRRNPTLKPVAVNFMYVDGADPARPWEAWGLSERLVKHVPGTRRSEDAPVRPRWGHEPSEDEGAGARAGQPVAYTFAEKTRVRPAAEAALTEFQAAAHFSDKQRYPIER